MPYVVAVTGGRDYADREHVFRVLDELHAERRIDVLVQGGATGADALARAWALGNLVQLGEFRVTGPQWHRSKRAGPVRNQLMLEVTRPSLLAAFPGNNGTNGCVEIAQRMGIAVRDERTRG